MNPAIVEHDYIYSRLADDPDLREIVDMFAEEMPDRIATLLDQLNKGDWESLRRTAHQLKGAAGSYGFDAVSPSAGKVESALMKNEPEEQIRTLVDALVEMCCRVRGGLPQP